MMKLQNMMLDRRKTMLYVKQTQSRGSLSRYKAISDQDLQLAETRAWLNTLRDRPATQGESAEQRAVGAILGLAIGDALGAPLEFQSVAYDDERLTGFCDTRIWEHAMLNKFALRPGQWTDDTAMALCLADSLLESHQTGFDPLDLRMRFVLWWQCGYNNAFGDDDSRPEKGSVGLGGNISLSMREFQQDPDIPYTLQGDDNTSGNGSLMRLAPCAVAFWRDSTRAMEVARYQSLTTHRGKEAAEACRLMAFILARAIASPLLPPPLPDPRELQAGPVAMVEAVLGDLSAFESNVASVQRLAAAEQEAAGECPSGEAALADRDWRWKNPKFRYSPLRAGQQPGYVGSYCMDALSMALHCVWSTPSFPAAVLKAANLRGDADTVAAITAQIAGAIYGVGQIPPEWAAAVQQWDGNGRIAARARRLFHLHSESAASTAQGEDSEP